MEVKPVNFVDGAGGLNNRDHPSKLAQNEFSILENAITDEGGWGGKSRLGQQLMQYAPIQPTGWQGVDSIVSISGTNPGATTVECASTEHLKVGMLLSFYDATPHLLEGSLAVASVVDATHFTIVNSVAFSNGNTFKQTGTLHLWHMNALAWEADDTVFVHDETAQIKDLSVLGSSPDSVAGLFPSATPLARLMGPNPGGSTTTPTGKNFRTTSTNASVGIDGLSSIMFDAWIYINPTFTGKPVVFADAYGSGVDVPFSNSGGHIVATQPYLATVPNYGAGGILDYGLARNGLSLWRDWDSVAGVDASDPYITFSLKTAGSGTQQLTSKYLPTGCWLFVRGSYIQASGKMRLSVNGELHAKAVASGAVSDSTDGIYGSELLVGGGIIRIDNGTPYNSGVPIALDARVEEIRIRTSISEAEEATFPFLEPRGKPWTLNKADGTKQLVVGAGDSLFYTVGDSAWVQINSAAKDAVGAESFSTTAYWDGIQIGDVLFLQNGVDNPKAWDGTKLYPWGNGTKALTLTKKTTAAGGLGVTGDVTYYYTYQYGDYETGPSVLTKVNLTAATDEVEIDGIPVGAPGCTGRKIYRVKSGAKYLVRTISDNTTVKLSGAFSGAGADPATDTGQDGLANTVLGTGKYVEMLAEVEFSAIPKGKYLLANYNRAFIVSADDPYSVFWTELNAPHVSLALSYVKAESDSGPVIGLAKYYGEVHASKNGKATLVLRGDNPSNWTQWEILHPTVGAVDHWSYVHRTIPQSDSYRLCFWGEDGAYAYAGQDFEKISDRIVKTVNGLSIENGNRAMVTVTTEADWAKAPGNNGDITANIYKPEYETDGLRQFSGRMSVVDVMEFQGLGSLSNMKVTAILKTATPGAFYFTCYQDKNLYYTTDNFITYSVKGTSPAAANFTGIQLLEGASSSEIIMIGYAPTTYVMTIYKWNGSAWTTIYDGVISVGGLQLRATQFVRHSNGLTNTQMAPASEVSVVSGSYASCAFYRPQAYYEAGYICFTASAFSPDSCLVRIANGSLQAPTIIIRWNLGGSGVPGAFLGLAPGNLWVGVPGSTMKRYNVAVSAGTATLASDSGQEYFPYRAVASVVPYPGIRPDCMLLALKTVGSGYSVVVLDAWRFSRDTVDLKKTYSAQSASVGAVITGLAEVATQTTTPYTMYAFAHGGTEDYMVSMTPAGVFATVKASPYSSRVYTRSNPEFCQASGAPDYTWPDRFYLFGDDGVSLSRVMQIGVAGAWTVVGKYTSQSFTLTGISAFDSLDSDYQGDADFYLRNAASVDSLAASELSVAPNSTITSFPVPAGIAQFRIVLRWVYAESAVSPYVDFVGLGYFSGSVNVPRVVGWHWKGRTYWSVAELGQTKNNLVLVYQKNNTWTLYKGWSIKGTNEFLGKLVALQNFELVQLEVGNKDLGNLICTKRRTGYIMDDQSDKCIRYAHVNVSAFVNSRFPTKGGWMKLVPYAADQPLDANWMFEIPAGATTEPRQVLATPIDASFPYQYARAFAIEVFTSDETGDYAPVVGQTEDLASLMLQLFVSHPRKRLARS